MKHNTLKCSLVTGAYYMLVNAVMGFEGFYLDKLGVSDKNIGLLIALAGICAVICQPLTGLCTDKSKKLDVRHMVFFISILVLLLGVSIVLFNTKYFPIVVYLVMIVLTSVAMPLVNSLSMLVKNKGFKIDFGIARGIGSISYALAAFLIGYFSEEQRFGYTFIPWAVIISSGLIILAILPFLFEKALSKSAGDESPSWVKKESLGLKDFAKTYPSFVVFVVFFSLIFMGHNILLTFVYQLIAPMGGTAKDVGVIGGLAACVELPAMFCFSLLHKKFSPAKLIKISGFFFFLKAAFCLISVATGKLYIFFGAQFFQIAGFALFTPASVYYANQVISEENIASGQSFMTASNVLGTILGSFVGGFFLDLVGGTGVMIITVSLTLVGLIAVQIILREKKTDKTDQNSSPVTAE